MPSISHHAEVLRGIKRSGLFSKNPQHRADFLVYVLRHLLFARIHAHELHDYGVYSRDLDACLEFGEESNVFVKIACVKAAIQEEHIWHRINEISGGQYREWYALYEASLHPTNLPPKNDHFGQLSLI